MDDPAPRGEDPAARSAHTPSDRDRATPHDPWADARRGRTLREVRPEAVGLDAAVLEELPGIVRAGLTHSPPRVAGASVLVASRAGIAYEHADGYALRWADASTQLPREQRIATRTDTLHDLASISKLFTAVAVMQLVEQGLLGLDDPVADHLPRFAVNGKRQVTVQHLLTHVGGLPAVLDLRGAGPDRASRLDAVLTVGPTAPPGAAYVYSDLGMITLGLLVEALTGKGLDEYVHAHLTAPLGMTETMYSPPAQLRHRIAATEYDEGEGRVVHGRVHDENASALGGAAGHAGVFSTARDLAVLAQMFLGGGAYGQTRILETGTVRAMFTDHVAAVTGKDGARRGLGPELAARSSHGDLTSPGSGGHTGFTGTSLVIDPHTDTIVILLANAVHPAREWSSAPVLRREVASRVARALGTAPATDRSG